ncbi:MAG: hypothetical protein M3460_20135 [Actinomycetota bacterium]|nr:hypothetical protein [Actinomycetota bacterium]
MTSAPALARRLLAEFIGTGLLVAVVVGSGIAAPTLGSRARCRRLLLGAVLILALYPDVSRAAADVVTPYAESPSQTGVRP